MTTLDTCEVPVLDLDLCCGSKTFSATLWRDEALVPLGIEDEVIFTHLRAPSAQMKFNSTSYTTIKHLRKLTEDVRELQYQSTVNKNLLMQLTRGSQEVL
ncbi:hypothetical protein DPX16_0649 [Anabarilius grahami]|uniref:Uncharacterized protein n=1 Tax=Anabarilius grahami TaxID=495550 RepID=A0A3N0Z9E2_ANAGA|nr:hypothetical protein DPX16_0649 [Anabarilius grahami]